MSITEQQSSPARGEWLRSNLLTVAIAGVLLTGGGLGLAFNHTSSPVGADVVAVVPGDPASDVTTPVSMPEEGLPAPTLVRSATRSSASFEAVTPPDNPFLRTTAEPLAVAVAPAVVPVMDQKLAAAQAKLKATAAAVSKATPVQPAVSAEALSLTGVVQGEPPLAVVRYEGQSLFLKIGDQVADTWRLVEIKERSAIFQLGAQRVEVPIKGGSSE